LPMSADLQWFIKLAVAIFASFAGLVIAISVAQALFGATVAALLGEAFGWQRLLLLLLAISSLLSFAAFWCACAGKSTTRAALWVFPALGAVLEAGSFGGWLGEKLLRNAGMFDFLILRFHPFPFSDQTAVLILRPTLGAFGTFAPPLL